LRAVEIRKRTCRHVGLFKRLRSRRRLKEPAAHDLEAFLSARWPLGGLDPADHVSETVERLAAADAADLDVICLGVGRATRVGRRKRDYEQAVPGSLCRLGQGLGEDELGLGASGRMVALVVELSRVGNPFVDEDKAGAVLLHQLAQHVHGARRLLVVGLDACEGLLAAELLRELSPERAYYGAIRFRDRVPRRDLVADEDLTASLWQRHHPGFGEYGIHAGEIARAQTAKGVPKFRTEKCRRP